MVKRTRTRIVMGTRETPNFVSRSFYQDMETFCSIYQYDFRLRPNTVRYFIPKHMVVERIWDECDFYYIDIDDSLWIPTCHRRKTLDKITFDLPEPKNGFDRFQCYTEEYSCSYYLLTPQAKFYDTAIFVDWSTRFLLYNDIVWRVDLKQIHVDPHNAAHTVWFFSHPKYSVEVTALKDFRGPNQEKTLQDIVKTMIPRSYRWD